MSVYAHEVSNLSNAVRKRWANCLLTGAGVDHDDQVFFLGNKVAQDQILLGFPHQAFSTQLPTTLATSDTSGFGHCVLIVHVYHHLEALIEEQFEPLKIPVLENTPLALAVTIAQHTLTCANAPLIHNVHVRVNVIVVGGGTDHVKII